MSCPLGVATSKISDAIISKGGDDGFACLTPFCFQNKTRDAISQFTSITSSLKFSIHLTSNAWPEPKASKYVKIKIEYLSALSNDE